MKTLVLFTLKRILICALGFAVCLTCVACDKNSDTNSSPNDSTDENTPLTISCWGDSLTEGMGVSNASNYPALLNDYLGKDKFTVLNGGDGGEDSITIMARQGAVKVFTDKEIVFNEGDVTAKIGDGKANGLVTADGDVLRLSPPLGRDMPINEITIGTEKYEILQRNFNWSDRSCEVYLKRTSNINEAVTIEKGTEVIFNSVDIATTNYCDIYLMGGNGGYNNDVNILIEQYKKMVAHRGNDNYIVLIPYWTASNATEKFIEAFGDKAIDFLGPANDKNLLENELQITLTDIDKQYLSVKRDVPPCLKLNNDANQGHLNEKGYSILAKVIYERGIELGYWQ